MGRLRPIAVLLILSSLLGCEGMCDDTVQNEAKSPDGAFVATLYVRDCGMGGSHFATRVNLRKTNAAFNADRGLVFVVEHDPAVEISWSDKRSLHIKCDDCIPFTEAPRPESEKRVFLELASWRDVEIRY